MLAAVSRGRLWLLELPASPSSRHCALGSLGDAVAAGAFEVGSLQRELCALRPAEGRWRAIWGELRRKQEEGWWLGVAHKPPRSECPGLQWCELHSPNRTPRSSPPRRARRPCFLREAQVTAARVPAGSGPEPQAGATSSGSKCPVPLPPPCSGQAWASARTPSPCWPCRGLSPSSRARARGPTWRPRDVVWEHT